MLRYPWLLRTFLVLGVFSVASAEQRQSKADPIRAPSLGLTPAAKSLPLWTKPSDTPVQDMARNIKALQEGVLLVGDPDVGRGTAFVWSRRTHRSGHQRARGRHHEGEGQDDGHSQRHVGAL